MSNEALHIIQQENNRLRDENRMLKDRHSHLRQAIRALNNMDKSLRSISPDTNVFDLVKNILSFALQAVDSEDGSLLLLDVETDELVFIEVAGNNAAELTGVRIPANAGIVGATVTSQSPWLVPDVRQEPRWSPQVDEVIGFQTLSLMCVPLIHEAKVLGAIEVVNTRSGNPFTEEDLDTLVLVARLAAIAIVRVDRLEPPL